MEVIQERRMIRIFKWLSKLALAMILLSSSIITVCLVGLLYLRSQPLPPVVIHENTTIYAIDGQVIDTMNNGQNRTYVPIEQMPVHLLQAAIAVEDQRFFQHIGLDFRRIAGAMIANLKQGTYAEGASTVTQQLARNLYLSHEKTWKRKLQEAIYALQLEMHLSKSQILERYLNQIYFGHSTYGVQAAAQLFFGKDVSELSIAESALLMGIPKGPRYYSPWYNEENARDRQQLILRLMEEQGFISTEQRLQASEETLDILSPEEHSAQADDLAPYFSDYVRSLAIHHYGLDETLVDQGGLRIYTTLDPTYQEAANQVIDQYLPKDRELQGALLAIDPRTGYIQAMVGGKDYFTSQYNRVLAERQPGSALKPFMYYDALELGMTPLTLMKSEPTTFTYDDGRATYTPHNFNDRYANDYITMERALATSDNIYAVKTLQFIGEETLIDRLHSLGFEQDFRPLPSLALGAQNVSLMEMVRGYSAFANEGKLPTPLAILRIEDRDGNVLVSEEPRVEQVLDPSTTFILTQMMSSVFEPGGTGHRIAHLLTRPVSGKTGSTDTDSWMIGLTPQLVAGVWVGYDQNQYIQQNEDGRLSAEIWARFMETALSEELPVLFSVPSGVVGAYVNPDNGKLATEHCPVKRLLYFREGTEPTAYCQDHLPASDAGGPPAPTEPSEPSSFWERVRQWWEQRP